MEAAGKEEWRSYLERADDVVDGMIQRMSYPDDPLVRRNLYRALFMTLSHAYQSQFAATAEYPDLLPTYNEQTNFLMPNPDGSYYHTPMEGGAVYTLSGYRGDVQYTDFSLIAGPLIFRGVGSIGPTVANYGYDHLEVDDDGYFEVLISTERPEGHSGNWWPLPDNVEFLLIRQFSYDWLKETDGRFAIERLDRPAIKPPMKAGEIDEKLSFVTTFARNYMNYTFDLVKSLYRDTGLINEVTAEPLDGVGGNTRQAYVGGIYDLLPDEALLYETELPGQCVYWNIQLTDELAGVRDGMNRQSSINGHTAHIDADGKFRAVIASADPGVPNWLDTAGRRQGLIFGRWTICDSHPVPSVQKIKLSEVRQHLPEDTPVVTAGIRDQQIRLRRKGAQLRRRW